MSPSSKKKNKEILGLNLETDAKTRYYSLLKLKYSPSIYLKHKKTKISILPKNLQIDQSFFASHGTHAMNYSASCGDFYASGTQDAEITKSLH